MLDREDARALQSCAFENTRRANRILGQRYDAALAPSGLRATQFALLAQLSGAGPIPVSRLAALLAMDRTTLTRNLGHLERAGYVALAQGADRRVRVVRLTEEGAKALLRALPLWREAQSAITSGFGQARLEALIGELKALAALAR